MSLQFTQSPQVSDLQWAQLVILGVFLPVMTSNLIVHACHRSMGWFFLAMFCALRVVGYALIKVGGSQFETGGIITQVALSSLLLGFQGVFYEA